MRYLLSPPARRAHKVTSHPTMLCHRGMASTTGRFIVEWEVFPGFMQNGHDSVPYTLSVALDKSSPSCKRPKLVTICRQIQPCIALHYPLQPNNTAFNCLAQQEKALHLLLLPHAVLHRLPQPAALLTCSLVQPANFQQHRKSGILPFPSCALQK